MEDYSGGFHGYYSLHRVSSGRYFTIEVLPYDRLLVRCAFDKGTSIFSSWMKQQRRFIQEAPHPKTAIRSTQAFRTLFSGQKILPSSKDRFRIALGEHPITVNELAAPHESARFPILKR